MSLGNDLKQEYKDAITSVGGEADLKYLPETVKWLGINREKVIENFSKEYDRLISGGGDANYTLYYELLNG